MMYYELRSFRRQSRRNHFKEAERQPDVSQGELGNRLNLSYRTIAEWESGRKIPRFDNALALARELDVSLKVLARALRLDVEGVPDDEPPQRSPSE